MTNEEAIELLNQEKIPMLLDGRPNVHLAVAHIEAIRALEENTKLKADNERIYSDINDKIIARRWNITSDCTPIECMCMDWANRMNDWCVEIVEQSLKNNL